MSILSQVVCFVLTTAPTALVSRHVAIGNLLLR